MDIRIKLAYEERQRNLKTEGELEGNKYFRDTLDIQQYDENEKEYVVIREVTDYSGDPLYEEDVTDEYLDQIKSIDDLKQDIEGLLKWNNEIMKQMPNQKPKDSDLSMAQIKLNNEIIAEKNRIIEMKKHVTTFRIAIAIGNGTPRLGYEIFETLDAAKAKLNQIKALGEPSMVIEYQNMPRFLIVKERAPGKFEEVKE